MTGYKREISYIYFYRRDEKEKNVGFAGVDVRENVCKVIISLKTPYEYLDGRLQAYLFVCEDDKLIGINIGSFEPVDNICKYKRIINGNNIENTGYSMNEISGVYIFNKEHPQYIFASSWDEKEIIGKKFEEYVFKLKETDAKSTVIEIIKDYIKQEMRPV